MSRRRSWIASATFLAALAFLVACVLPGSAGAARLSSPYIHFIPGRIPRGTVALITYTGPPNLTPEKILWRETAYPFFKNEKGRYQALLGLPLGLRHRRQFFTLVATENGTVKSFGFAHRITLKRYPVRSLTLKKHAKLNAETLERIKRERAELFSVLKTVTPERLWRGRFARPVPGGVTSGFGVRRKINGAYTSVHHGVDFRALLKTPVRAINAGRVVLLKKMYLSGLTLVIDHGLGLYSLYGHLAVNKVSPGDRVKKGDIIALSGNTGRSTGPHLHLGVTLCGITVDPLTLIHLPL